MTENFNEHTPMHEVESRFPFARSTLHAHFHIGGCASCGYEPQQTVGEVAQKYQKNPSDLLICLNESYTNMLRSELTVEEFQKLKNSTNKILIIDVREEWEFNIAHIPDSIRLHEGNFQEIVQQTQSMPDVIVVCHHGMRSMNATLYLREHGVPQAKSLTGGIDAYSLRIDSRIPRY